MVEQRREGAVTWLTLNRPDRLNAFTAADYGALRRAVERAVGDAATRVIVLTANGRAFSAGADRSLLAGAGSASDSERSAAGEAFSALLEVLGGCEKPLIAAVNGLAVGFGCTVLLYCDLILAARSARFRLPFTALGIVPEAGSSVLLAARARWDEALWAMLSSEWFDAADARAMGLVWRTVPDDSLLDETALVAETLASLDPSSVVATKRLLTAGRAEAARLATGREAAEMARLAAPAAGAGPRQER